eukprot:TRINITY_DN65948_c6_g11_i1.p1 TRINITY_DN65948_c6_g11~~TRINITY_DN65948_c6_g11_i1.p1  ORF type:complete len:316 (-),score=179.69 TRINITY_DN65948_c6_g11_i1:1253-2200(-)
MADNYNNNNSSSSSSAVKHDGGGGAVDVENGGVHTDVVLKTLTGQQIKVTLPGSPATILVQQVKAKLNAQRGIPPDFQRLIFQGKELVDGNTLASYRIESGMIVHLVLRQKTQPAQPVQPVVAGAAVGGYGDGAGGEAPPVAFYGGGANGANGAVAGRGNGGEFAAGGGAQFAVAGGNPVGNMELMHRAFVLGRIVKIFAIIDAVFSLLMMMRQAVYLLGVLFALAGFHGARRYLRNYTLAYAVYTCFTLGMRVYTIFADDDLSAGGRTLLVIGVIIEIYILKIIFRFLKSIRELPPADLEYLRMMQQQRQVMYY